MNSLRRYKGVFRLKTQASLCHGFGCALAFCWFGDGCSPSSSAQTFTTFMHGRGQGKAQGTIALNINTAGRLRNLL